MKNNRKIIIAAGVVALIAASAGIIYATSNPQREELSHNVDVSPKNENANYRIASSLDLAYDNSNAETMASKSDGIALVTIESLDGVSNYGKGVQQYVHPYTYGQMEVIQTLKGDIKEGETVKFSRLGGTMPFDEYLEGLSEAERAKISALNSERKDVKLTFEGDIDIEAGKTYLVYLMNSTVHYAEPGAYEIVGFEGGLREIQTTSGYSVNSNSSDLKVLNNFTGEWENLNDVVKQGK